MTGKEIEYLNNTITIKETESVFKIFSQRKSET